MFFRAVVWYGQNAETGELLKVVGLDFAEDDELILEIEMELDTVATQGPSMPEFHLSN